jgi:hypothetical protein
MTHRISGRSFSMIDRGSEPSDRVTPSGVWTSRLRHLGDGIAICATLGLGQKSDVAGLATTATSLADYCQGVSRIIQRDMPI